MRNQDEGPADAAWEKAKVFHGPYPAMDKDTARLIFAAGWNAALDWIPFRIRQFRELEEGLRREIEELKSQIPSS